MFFPLFFFRALARAAALRVSSSRHARIVRLPNALTYAHGPTQQDPPMRRDPLPEEPQSLTRAQTRSRDSQNPPPVQTQRAIRLRAPDAMSWYWRSIVLRHVLVLTRRIE
eukprot:2674610-Rhodomonas_salina.1